MTKNVANVSWCAILLAEHTDFRFQTLVFNSDQMMVPVQGIYSSSNESSLDTFCSAPILSCAFKGENDRGESLASCVIGFEVCN